MHNAPLLLDIPESFETDRLTIRCLRAGDGSALHNALLETLEDLRGFPASLPWAMTTPSVADTEAYCRMGYANFIARQDFPLILICKKTGQVAGASGLHRFKWEVPKFEIGYWCRRSFQGRGLITEAVSAIASFAFDTLGARRVEIFTDDLNTASWRVCERAGFALEGVLRHERVDSDGTPRNTRVYAKIR